MASLAFLEGRGESAVGACLSDGCHHEGRRVAVMDDGRPCAWSMAQTPFSRLAPRPRGHRRGTRGRCEMGPPRDGGMWLQQEGPCRPLHRASARTKIRSVSVWGGRINPRPSGSVPRAGVSWSCSTPRVAYSSSLRCPVGAGVDDFDAITQSPQDRNWTIMAIELVVALFAGRMAQHLRCSFRDNGAFSTIDARIFQGALSAWDGFETIAGAWKPAATRDILLGHGKPKGILQRQNRHHDGKAHLCSG
jgi:hypothetical protein